MRIWPFRPNQENADAEAVLAAVTAASRQPGLFGVQRVPDTLEGRFEMIVLHAALALARLRQQRELAQIFTDKLFRHFDAGLREAGVGDLVVPKRMQKLAGAFYGRLKVYDLALSQGGTALAGALARNALAGEAGFAPTLAAYALATAARQAGLPAAALAAPEAWAPAPP